ncbi:MAG: cytochrome-c peroxidase, partial [Vicinamibacteraceae bacterium]
MRSSLSFTVASILLLGCLLASLRIAAQPSPEPAIHEPVAPVHAAVPSHDGKAQLGEKLFNDVRLSGGKRTACSSCHLLAQGGDHGRLRTRGADGHLLPFNVPTVFNASLSFRLNWRGNFRTLEEQAEAVLLDPRLMNTSWRQLIAELRGTSSYAAAFARIYGREPRRADVLDAIARFERTLVTPNARFDRYLRGEEDAITRDERRGYELFQSHGCTACHQG